jgi:hypothetical protein
MLESPLASRGLAAQAPSVPPPPVQPSGEATRAFFTGTAQPEAAPSAEKGPGEFTRMFEAPAKAPGPARPKAAAKAPARPPIRRKKKSPWPLILIVGGIVLLIGLILVIVLRH